MEIKIADKEEKQVVKELFIKEWHSDLMVSRGYSHYVDNLDAIIVKKEGELVGLLTYHFTNDEIELVSLDSFDGGKGIGTKLLDFAIHYFKTLAPKRIWLITSNDNCHAMRFYQKRGWKMVK